MGAVTVEHLVTGNLQAKPGMEKALPQYLTKLDSREAQGMRPLDTLEEY